MLAAIGYDAVVMNNLYFRQGYKRSLYYFQNHDNRAQHPEFQIMEADGPYSIRETHWNFWG